MTHASFQLMLADLFRIVGPEDGRALPGAGHCRCRGLDVALYHDDDIDPDNVHAYIDFGAVPPPRQREVFRTLLLRPLHFARPHRAVVGLDGDTGRIVLVARIAFDDSVSGERMADILGRFIRQVDVWRTPKPVRVPSGRRAANRRWS